MDIVRHISRLVRRGKYHFLICMGLSRREITGILLIYPAGLLYLFLAPTHESTLLPQEQERFEYVYVSMTNPPKAEPEEWVAFDPDTITTKQLIRHGLPPDIARRWENYRLKAGGFKSVSQVQNLYGLTDSVFQIIQSHLHFNKQGLVHKATAEVREKLSPGEESLDVNLSDTLLWRSLRGIGPVLSRRIVAYRTLLGGFVRVEQVGEVYGIDSTLFESIFPRLYIDENFVPLQLNIFHATYQQLRAHPYISARQASAIIHYRAQHGPADDFSFLYKLEQMDSSSVKRLVPYLTLEAVNNEGHIGS